jgi:hypothetical protein
LPPWFPPLFYLLLAVVFLWRSTLAGDVFLPAGLLGHVAPWSARIPPDQLPPWNPLRWDGIAQFYPWRHFAAQTMRSGIIPLWNPFQFCGTPFVANSQSAVLYPGNLLFYLLPTPQAFGWSAVLHLTLCGWFLYLLLRRLRCGEGGALLGGIVYAYSSWQVAWLQLPTFLAVSCWFPLLLRQIHILAGPALVERTTGSGGDPASLAQKENSPPSSLPRGTAALGGIVGMMLLAGHLQIAFYGLLAGSLWAVCLLIVRSRECGTAVGVRFLAACLGGLALGLMLAAPQMLPTLELSRVSHRAGKPTAEGYQAYIDYALPPGGLVLLTLPEFYGGDADPGNPYWGFYNRLLPNGSVQSIRHNAAETAAYVGVVPLLLGLLALLRSRRKLSETSDTDRAKPAGSDWNLRVLFMGGLALLALFLALGTPLDALFYFRVPGFGQSGSPARALVLWALAWAALAGFGLDALQRRAPTKREISIVVGIGALILAFGLSLAAAGMKTASPNFPIPLLGDVFSRIGLGWARLALGFFGGAALLLPFARRAFRSAAGKPTNAASAGTLPVLVPAGILLVGIELFWAGIGVNPTAKPEWVYPETPGLALVRAQIGHERIFPVNQRWSLYKSPPAVFPPNAATVYGLRDVQGYDSLFTGQYKAFANRFARPNAFGGVDASPPEVGNMVFFQNPKSPLVPMTAAVFALTPAVSSPAFVPEAAPPGSPVYNGDEMAVYRLPGALPRAVLVPTLPTPGAIWSAHITADGPTRVTVETNGPSGTLLLNDQFYPGRHAFLDGKSVPIRRRADAPIFCAVDVPAGRHVVAFRYEPASFRVGLYLASAACALLAMLVFSSPPPR